MDYKYCPDIYKYEPTFETVDILPDIDYNHLNRYVYLTTDNRFYISSDGGWVRLGLYPVKEPHLLLDLDDSDETIKAETFDCWIEGDRSNIQFAIEDIKLFIYDYKNGSRITEGSIKNIHFDISGFNAITAATLPVYIIDGVVERDTHVQVILDELIGITDNTCELTDTNISGTLLGDPSFTISDGLILNERYIGNIQSDDISYDYYDTTSAIQFAIDAFNKKCSDNLFIGLTGVPTIWRTEHHYLRTNGIDWTTFSIISADEIYAPLDICFEAPKSIMFNYNGEEIIMELDDPTYEPCQCDVSQDVTISLQQSICKLYMFKYDCVEYIKLGYLANTDADLELLMPDVVDDTCQDFSGDQQVIYDDWLRFGPNHDNVPADLNVHGISGFSITNGLISTEGDSLTYNGFYAPFACEKFEISATVSSPEDWDDDPVTLMICRNGSNTLCAVRTCGANRFYFRVSQWSIVYNYEQGDEQVVVEGANFLDNIAESTKWNGSSIMMWANRTGFMGRFVTCKTSNLDGSILEESLISVDLCEMPILRQFLGPKPMGFGAVSIANMTWTNLRIQKIAPSSSIGPNVNRVIYDIRDNGPQYLNHNDNWIHGSWVYVDGEWKINTCQTLENLERNKMYFNPVTKKLFYIACDGVVICLICLPIPEIDYCTCEYYYED